MLACLLAPACGGGGEYRLHVIFPDEEARQAVALLTLWAVEAGAQGCPAILEGSVDPDSLPVLSRMEIDPAAQPSLKLRQVPAGEVLFVAEGTSPGGYVLLRGCQATEVLAGEILEVDLLLEWVCRPLAEGEIRGNGVDDDCDGLTDECLEDTDCHDDNICTADACEDQVCRNVPVENGTLCEDGAFCTALDTCENGVCSGESNGCDDGDPCTDDSCDEVLNRCDHTPVLVPGSEGPPADPSCTNGLDDDCDGWTDDEDPNCRTCAVDAECDDGYPCTADACVGQVCVNNPLADGEICDDQDACTMDDVCTGGNCRGAPLDADGDGYGPQACGGDDCDDEHATANPGESEGDFRDPSCHDGLDNDCDERIDYDHPECLQQVAIEPVYPGHADWNDYLRNDDPSVDIFRQDEVSCDGTETGGYGACLHGGEMRAFTLAGRANCDGLSAQDALGAFAWECDDNGGQGPVTFRSRSLAAGKGLGDLLEAQGFLANSVSVDSGGTTMASSQPAVWGWSNPVLAPPDNSSGGAAALDEAGTIYLVASDARSAGYNLDADRIALVVSPGFALTYSGDGSNNCQLATGEMSPPSEVCLLAAGGQNFLWIEGTYHAYDGIQHSRYGIALAEVDFSVVRKTNLDDHRAYALRWSGEANSLVSDVVVFGNWGGLSFEDADWLTLRDVTSLSNTATGVRLNLSDNVDALRITAGGNGGTGLSLSNLTGATVRQIRACNNDAYGVILDVSAACALSHLTVSNTGFVNDWDRAILVDDSQDIVVTHVVTFGNEKHGLAIIDSDRVTVSHLSSFNNFDSGVQVLRADNCTLNQVLTVNNRHNGLTLGDLTGTQVANLAATHNEGTGPYGWNASYNTFTGFLMVGYNNDSGTQCYMGGAESPGLISGTCTDDGAEGSSSYTGQASDAVLHIDRNMTFSFVAKVFSDDSVNQSDQNGMQVHDLIDDWTGFENRYRGWGRDGGGFPGSLNRGRCVPGDGCRIWDWRIVQTDTVIRGFNGTFEAGQECPAAVHGDMALTDQQDPPNVFLMHAEEILDDGAGDDDGLCESDERCVFSPAVGAYQGEGGIPGTPCLFQDGLVTGVTLLAHSTDGT